MKHHETVVQQHFANDVSLTTPNSRHRVIAELRRSDEIADGGMTG